MQKVSNGKRWKVKPEILYSKINEETVLMSIEAGFYYSLDSVGSQIWELLTKQSASIEELSDRLINEYEVDKETCLKDVQEFIDELASKKLIIPVEQENPPEK